MKKKSPTATPSKAPKPAKPGRPTVYNEKLGEAILERLMDGESLRRICMKPNMPHRATVLRWMGSIEGFATKSAHARVIQADALMDDMADIENQTLAGKLDPAAARAVLSSKQWRAAKLAPKKYGDRHVLEHSGPGGAPIQQMKYEMIPANADPQAAIELYRRMMG